MSEDGRLIAAFLLAMAGTCAVTPAAIALAKRVGFQDVPVGYKAHRHPTPYLGGAAVLLGFLAAWLLLAGELPRLAPAVAGALALWVLGTLDDLLGLSIYLRLAVEAGAGAALWAANLGWNPSGVDALDLAVTVAWTLALVNAFNLMDNMDGAAGAVAAVTSLAVAVLALLQGDPGVGILCLALCGACLGFLPYNLARPARIFLGDGGSLPVGFVIAAAVMALPDSRATGWATLFGGLILAGLPVIDTGLVLVSRRRAGLPLFRGGRDHLTHRLLAQLPTPRIVSATLALAQAGLAAIAIAVMQLDPGAIVSAGCIWLLVATALIAVLETEAWVPARNPKQLSPPG